MSDIKVQSITPNPPADFTPSMGDYQTLQPFRYWCQNVLPLLYDDSLSYYELLCKVVDYLNKTMQDVETLHGDVTNLHTAYEQLQAYVNNYFSTLDVQEEINKKLDDMVTSGEFANILSDTFGFYVTPQMFGGKNDGVNDCTKAFKKCLESKLPVFLPAGTYLISENITIPNGKYIFGNAKVTKYYAISDFTDGLSILKYSGSGTFLTIQTNTTIKNVVIDGDYKAENCVQIKSETTESNDLLEDVLICKANTYGLIVGQETAGANISYGSYFTRVECCYCKVGVFSNASDLTFFECQFYRNKENGGVFRQAQVNLIATLFFNNYYDNDQINTYEIIINNGYQMSFISCAFDSQKAKTNVRLVNSHDINFYNTRFRNATDYCIACDTTSYFNSTNDYYDFASITEMIHGGINNYSIILKPQIVNQPPSTYRTGYVLIYSNEPTTAINGSVRESLLNNICFIQANRTDTIVINAGESFAFGTVNNKPLNTSVCACTHENIVVTINTDGSITLTNNDTNNATLSGVTFNCSYITRQY